MDNQNQGNGNEEEDRQEECHQQGRLRILGVVDQIAGQEQLVKGGCAVRNAQLLGNEGHIPIDCPHIMEINIDDELPAFGYVRVDSRLLHIGEIFNDRYWGFVKGSRDASLPIAFR